MPRGWIGAVALLMVVGAVQTSAHAFGPGPTVAMTHVPTIRTEPTRPGGLPGAPRETTATWHYDQGAAQDGRGMAALHVKSKFKRKHARH